MTTSFKHVLDALNDIAPPELAAPWDNVGLLVENHAPTDDINRLLLTIDLTPAVMKEALEHRRDVIVCYHPVIFGGLKRLRAEVPTERVILDAIRSGISIYSPHTALDAVEGGVNDWLLDAVGKTNDRHALEPATIDTPQIGMGRRARLVTPTSVDTLLGQLQEQLGLNYLRVARSQTGHEQQVEHVAVCPGAGGSLLAPLTDIDLVVTGEMRHHDVLAMSQRGITVCLTEHSNCERGYLATYRTQLNHALQSNIDVMISKVDSDPIDIWDPNRVS